MALIGTLRNKMGIWLVAFVFVAIAAFILGDLLGNNSVLLGRNDVGEIGGKTISLSDYQAAVKEMETNYMMSTNKQPGEREMVGVRQQAWDRLIARYTVEEEYDKLGIVVTTEELRDMVVGKNIDPNIQQAFTDRNTGQFDRSQVSNYLQRINGEPPTDPQTRAMWEEEKVRWDMFQKELRPARERLKYENLLIKSNYITKAELEHEYHIQNDVAEVKYLYVPYFAVSDSAIKVEESDLTAYYDKHKNKYKTEHTKDIKYVRFDIAASKEDTLAVREDMQKMVDGLHTAENDSAYAVLNSDAENPYESYNIGDLPAYVNGDSLTVGKIFGPFVENDALMAYKISSVTRDTVEHAKASHILIRWADTSDAAKKEAKEKAQKILNDIKDGADFAAKAREFGTDASASSGGDLGWFPEGQMVKPFNDAVFNATHTGVLNNLVETEYGYHIIDVTSTKENRKINIAVISRTFTPGDETINSALRNAELFASTIKDLKSFEAKAKEDDKNILEAGEILSTNQNVGALGDARRIVQWLFRDASVGSVSQVFDLQDVYVVAVETGEIEKGYKSLDAARDEIMDPVKNELKAKQINAKLSTLQGSLDDMAKAYGDDAAVYSKSDVKLNGSTLPGANLDPRAVGLAFSLKDGERSKPFNGENGVLIMETQHKTTAPELGDYSIYKTALDQKNSAGLISYNIQESIKDESDIEDNRYKFY